MSTVNNGVEAYYRDEHGDNPIILRTAADVDALIDSLLEQTWENETAALFHRDHPVNEHGLPDHEFYVAVDAESQTGSLRYGGRWQGEGGTWLSKGDSGKIGTVLHFYMGHDNDWPADSEIPLDAVRAAVKQFLATTGQRPTTVRWQPHWTMLEEHPELQGCA